MPTLSVVVAGLIAVIVKGKTDSAAAVLMKHDQHPHCPSLLVPQDCVSDETAVTKLRRTDLAVLAKARLPRPLADYAVYDVTGIDLAVLNRPIVAGLKIFDPPIPESGCPDKGDWSSLAWLLDLNAVSGKNEIRMRRDEIRRSLSVASQLGLGPGELSGHPPVETASKVKKFSYEGMKSRAFTDAAVWTTTADQDIEIGFVERVSGRAIGTLKLRADVNALLLNLPDPSIPSPPGAHIGAFQALPFDDGTSIGSIAEDGACGGGTGRSESLTQSSDTHSLTLVVTTTGAKPSELSVSATARYGSGAQGGSGHSHGSLHGDIEPRGDSLCMGVRICVDTL